MDKLRAARILGSDREELGREDLLREVERGLLALGRPGDRDSTVFPPAVRVRISVRDGSRDAVRAIIGDPAFERLLEERLANRLTAKDALPARTYEVDDGEISAVVVEEAPAAILAVLTIQGGDRDGDRHPLEAGRREWRLGRGAWHQERPDDQRLPNDVVLTDTLAWVSRAACVLRRGGARLELEARQQGEFVTVVRRDGAQLRPAVTASGRVPVAPGDRIEFHDGANGRLVVRVTEP
jgi:hypothetical protein